jgi:hypothetical protein
LQSVALAGVTGEGPGRDLWTGTLEAAAGQPGRSPSRSEAASTEARASPSSSE